MGSQGAVARDGPSSDKDKNNKDNDNKADNPTNDNEGGTTTSLAQNDKLTSNVYGPDHPPTHWSDTVFLIPHEWLRREMECMVKSTEALSSQSMSNEEDTTSTTAWKAEMLATWIVELFVPSMEFHHDNEEYIYIPLMISKGCEIDDKKISTDHKSLILLLTEIKELAHTIQQAKGLNCTTAIASFKTKVPAFVKKLNEHLQEEETMLPGPIKQHISLEENDAAVQQMIQAAGVEGLKMEFPAILCTLEEWATPEHYQEYVANIPPPIMKLQEEILIPNYKTYYCAMRDAPLQMEKPDLTQLPFDASMLPPLPPITGLSS